MEYKRIQDKIFLRCDPGEEILEQLNIVCEKEDVRLALISGLGSVTKAVIGIFDLAEKHFYATTLEEPMEIGTLTGTVTNKNGAVYLHVHAVLGKTDGTAYTGHLKEGVVMATAEIELDLIEGEVGRRFVPETGLHPMVFS